ncbi:MAG TPA: NIPSNAP family protein [Bryobacteraceae bacterium]|nr:NIPSNAP family protein [Bryobacteraceae bacterium]
MHRRTFLTTVASAGLATPPAAAGPNALLELRYIWMRTGSQVTRTTEFLEKYLEPAARRQGLGPLGFFNAVIAAESPFVLTLTSYPSFEAFGQARDRMHADPEFRKGFEEYNSMSELSYIRMENSLLRAFDGMPRVAVPPARAGRSPRVFELRTYESNNGQAARTKIGMFNQAEIGIFQRLGMLPVFFGETLVGRNLPNLTYMLAFDDLAARERLWRAFGSDPGWQKLRARPEFSDALIVSNISNAILRPLPFSQIR